MDNNDMTYHSDAIYTENKITLLWLMGPCTVYDENQIRKWHDWSYKCSLHLKQNWVVVTDQTR